MSLKYLLAFLLLLTGIASAQKHVPTSYTHDIAVTAFTSPATGQRMPLNISTPVSFHISNQGTSSESNIRVYASIATSAGTVVYRDTASVASLGAGNTVTVQFKDFLPQLRSQYTFTAISQLASDQNSANDTLVGYNSTFPQVDASATSVISPALGEVVRRGTRFRPIGVFSAATSNTDLFDVPVKVLIHRCSDGVLVFQSDSTIDALLADSSTVTFPFPSSEGVFRTWLLLPGCYTIAVIARYPTDGDRTNDTAYSTFTIDHSPLPNDLSVDSIITAVSLVPQPNAVFPIAARITNAGSNDQSSVRIFAQVLDSKNAVIYRDSSLQSNWSAGTARTLSFHDLNLTSYGSYVLRIFSALNSDADRSNDTLQSTISVGYHNDADVLSIVQPAPDTVFASTYFSPLVVTLKWIAMEPYGSIPVSISLIRLEDLNEVYSDQTNLYNFSQDNPLRTVQFGFLPRLSVGHYRLTIIANTPGDSNRTNDTLRSAFEVRIGDQIDMDSIVTPSFGDTLHKGPIDISAFAINHGLNDLQSTEVDALIRMSSGVIAYRDTIQATNWASGERRLLRFNPFSPRFADTYTLEVTAINTADFFSRNSAASSKFYYQPLSGVHQKSESDLTLSFDPTSKLLHCQVSESGNIEVRLHDMLGREVWSFNTTVTPGFHTFEMDHGLASGTYSVEVRMHSQKGVLVSRTMLLQR